MSLIRNISIGLSTDSARFTLDIDKAAGSLDRIARSATAAQAAVGTLNLDRVQSPSAASASASGSASGSGSAAAAAPAGGDLGVVAASLSTLPAALAPLATIGATITAELNAVGGTITTLARRISGALQFTSLTTLQDKLQNGITAAAKAAEAALKGMAAAAAGTGAAVPKVTLLQKITLALGPAALKAVQAYSTFSLVTGLFKGVGDVAKKTLTSLSKTSFGSATASANQLRGSLASISPTAAAAGTSVKKMGSQILLALGVFALVYKATQAIAGFFTGGIKGAIDLNETINKTKQVFGDATGSITAQADQLARSYGLPKRAVLDAASAIGLIGTGSGQSQKQAAGLATTMTQLAADASSFYNVPLDVALDKINSGLVGESKPLRDFGVILSEDAVKTEALRMGLIKGKQELDEQGKVAARASLILKGLTKAQGDLARTGGDAKNQMRKLSGDLENTASALGAKFMPAVNAGIGVLSELATALTTAFSGGDGIVSTFVEYLTAGFQTISLVIRNFPLFANIAWLTAKEGFINFVAYLEVLPTNLGIIASYIAGNWRELIFAGVDAVLTLFINLGTNIRALWTAIQGFLAGEGFKFEWTPLLDGFNATVKQLPEMLKPELVSMQSDIDKLNLQINANELARTNKKPSAAAPKPALGDLGGGAKKPDAGAEKYQGTAAVEFGSKEASSAIARFRNQGADDKPAKETAKNTAAANGFLGGIFRVISEGQRTRSPVGQAIADL